MTEKYKDFIERTAKKIQASLPSFGAPNKYNYSEILKWLEHSGAKIVQGDVNRTIGNTIQLQFLDSNDSIFNDKKCDFESSKIFFHEMWHFISNKINNEQGHRESSNDSFTVSSDGFHDKSISLIEISANYFSRAMLFPEKNFLEEVMKNVDVNGNCDIYNVAEQFSASYTDVIARGNDLNLWNTKVG